MKLKFKLLSLVLVSMLFVPLLFHAAFAQVSYLNSTVTSLESIAKQKKSVSVFYPIFLMIALAFFMAYALLRRDDKLAAVFSIAACLVCIILSIMFLAPIDFTYQVSEVRITAEQSHITNMIANNTSIVKDSFNTNMIPSDPQFRFILSSFFSVFSLLNGLMTILIFTRWSKEVKT